MHLNKIQIAAIKQIQLHKEQFLKIACTNYLIDSKQFPKKIPLDIENPRNRRSRTDNERLLDIQIILKIIF